MASLGQMLPVRLDLHLMAPSSLRVENNVAHVVASADLWIRGTYDHPLLSGGVDVERGDVLFEGHRYVVRRGRVEFPNPTKIEPFFDIAGETLVRAPGQTYVVNLQMTGTLKNFTTSETSDPPLSQVEILSLLFGAETTNAPLNPELGTLQVEGTEKTLAASRLQQAAAGVVSAPITRAVEQTFGLDTFQNHAERRIRPLPAVESDGQADGRQADLQQDLPDVLAEPEHPGRRRPGHPARIRSERPALVDLLAERGRHLRARRAREARVLMRIATCVLAISVLFGAMPAAARQPATPVPLDALLGKPIVEVRLVLSGQPLQDSGVASALETQPGSALTATAVRRSLVHLMAMARFSDVAVDARLTTRGVVLTYEMMPVSTVEEIAFRGDLGLPLRQLRSAVTDRYGSTPEAWRGDEIAAMLEANFRDHGYLNATVKTTTEPAPGKNRIRLVFDVKAGPPATVGTAHVNGAPDDTGAQVLTRLGITPGTRFDRLALDAAVRRYVEEFCGPRDSSAPPLTSTPCPLRTAGTWTSR